MKRVYNRMIKKYDGSEVEFTFDDERPIQEQMDKEGGRYKKQILFEVPKIEGSVLETMGWNINASYDELVDSECIATLGDCQLLKTLRKVSNHPYEEGKGVELKRKYKKAIANNNPNAESLRMEIIEQKYIPDYFTVVFEDDKQYLKLIDYEVTKDDRDIKIIFNGIKYTRLSCSPAQARKKIVVFCNEKYTDTVRSILNAGRDISAKMPLAKFNAYFGLYSSVSSKVTMPRIAIIGSYNTTETIHTMYEIPWDEVLDENNNQKYTKEKEYFDVDSVLEEQWKEEEFNRFDGGGIIRPEMALQWAYDLGLDYVPANFCIRYTFTKGAVACFDFVKWCTEKNDGNYIMKDIFGNEFDVREKDIIITKDMAKMIKQWSSVEEYVKCSEIAGVDMRVTKYAPKEDRSYNTLNYQYIQTLNWPIRAPYNWEYMIKKYGYKKAKEITGFNDDDLYNLATKTINHYNSIRDNIDYKTILFLCGKNGVINELEKGEDWLNKCLAINPSLINDSYTKTQFTDATSVKITESKLGDGIERGNYQCLVPDSYAFCEFMAGVEVKGLLGRREDGKINCYSKFWNSMLTRDKCDKFISNGRVREVALARSPQTYKSEWVKCNLVMNAETEKWYIHQYTGFITPIYTEYTLELAGSDFDYDIGFTTDDEIILKRIFTDKPVTSYKVPKPEPAEITIEGLMRTDANSFGQKIGQITNVATAMFAKQSNYEEDSEEYKICEFRQQMCCIAQSKQIDKTKIGQDVKEIPKSWYEGSTQAEKNVALKEGAESKPYFMRYNPEYDQVGKAYNIWKNKYSHLNWEKYYEDISSLNNKELKKIENSLEELKVDTCPCPMNRWAWYIEAAFDNKKKEYNTNSFNPIILMNSDCDISLEEASKEYEKIIVPEMNKCIKVINAMSNPSNTDDPDELINISKEACIERYKNYLISKLQNKDYLSNYLIRYFFIDKENSSKSIFWKMVGAEVCENMLNNYRLAGKEIKIPIKSKDNKVGEVKYLYSFYDVEEFTPDEIASMIIWPDEKR